MLDLAGPEITAEEKDILDHPGVGGVIFFTRNYVDIPQLTELVRQCRRASRGPLLLAVDHEGGRVQRFRQGFTAIPAMDSLRSRAKDPLHARQLCRMAGKVMAAEVRAMDIDISFAPVLDINGISDVIGDRAFSDNTDEVVTLAGDYIRGMNEVGMAATGKHFPGHGSVKADSHIAMPVDERPLSAIEKLDMAVFKQLMKDNLLAAVMPAHVIYPQIDSLPAGFSPVWLQQILRQQLGFSGAIFSDDLSMQGAAVVGDYPARARSALSAGVDMLLCCNNPAGAVRIIDALGSELTDNSTIDAMAATNVISWQQLKADQHYRDAVRALKACHD